MKLCIANVSRSPRKLLASRLPEGSVVIDVGCGDMMKAFQYVHTIRPDIRIIGVEKYADKTIYGDAPLAPDVAKAASMSRVACDIENESLPFASGSIGGAYCSHVLEHLRNVTRPLGEIFRVLAPGGLLYVEVPGPRALVMPRDAWLAKQTVNYPLNHWNDATHVAGPFTFGSLSSSLRSVGFEILKAGYHREFGRAGLPIYAAALLTGLLPWPSKSVRSSLIGAGWWNLVGWPIFALAQKPI